MIARTSDQNKVETDQGENIEDSQFTESQCERFQKALIMKALIALGGKIEISIKMAKQLPPNAEIESYSDNELGIIGMRVKPTKRKRGIVVPKKKKIIQ